MPGNINEIENRCNCRNAHAAYLIETACWTPREPADDDEEEEEVELAVDAVAAAAAAEATNADEANDDGGKANAYTGCV